MNTFKVYYLIDGTAGIESGTVAKIAKGRVEFTDGGWCGTNDCFLTARQCRRYHRLDFTKPYERASSALKRAAEHLDALGSAMDEQASPE